VNRIPFEVNSKKMKSKEKLDEIESSPMRIANLCRSSNKMNSRFSEFATAMAELLSLMEEVYKSAWMMLVPEVCR